MAGSACKLVFPVLALVLVLAPGAGADEDPDVDGWQPEDTLQVRRLGDVAISPDGRLAYTVTVAVTEGERSDNLTHIHLVDLDGTDGRQLTFGEHSTRNPTWSPDGRWLAFTSDRSGKNNLWLIHPDGGESWRLTDVATGVGAFRFSPLGNAIAFVMAEPPTESRKAAEQTKDDARVVGADPQLSHLWLVELPEAPDQRPEPRRLTEGPFTLATPILGGMDWSPDGRSIAFTHTPTAGADDWPLADISVVDVDSGEVTPRFASDAAESSPVYSRDGRWLALQRSDSPPTWGFTADLYLAPADAGEPRRLGPSHDRFRVNLLGFSADDRELLFVESRGTVSRLAALPVDGGPARDLDLGPWVVRNAALGPAGERVGFVAESSTEPAEAFVLGLAEPGPSLVTQANAHLPDHPLGRTEVIRWQGPDELEIEGLLTYPVGHTPGRRVPLLLVVHGGPAGVYQQTYLANPSVYPLAVFAQRGYAVLRANPRGSSGYGRDFRYANYADWGGKDFQDLMAGVDRVIEMGVADPERLGVMGWSYGGFMTSWIVTQTDRFRAASIGAPVTHLVSFTGTADIPGFIPDYMGGEFWQRPETWRDHSPLLQVRDARTPSLILHGENDIRVPVSQGHEFHNALKRLGVETQMVVYPRTPHGIREPKLRLDAMGRNLEWFGRHVLGEQPAAED